MYGLCLPTGEVYVNEIKPENSCMITDITSYEEFIEECRYLFDDNKVNKVIYKDEYKYYEILRDELINSEF